LRGDDSRNIQVAVWTRTLQLGCEMTTSYGGKTDLLADWVDHLSGVIPRPRGHRVVAAIGGLRFAFYGRISTSEYQDPASSGRWQLDSAADIIAGHGTIVAEFLDIGCSRSLPWAKRPHAAALLATLENPNRGFDAIVGGDYERAFAGSQLLNLLPQLDRYCVQLWLPEVGGPIDTHDPMHRALITCSATSPAAKSCGPGGVPPRRCAPKSATRDGIKAADRPTGTDWSMPDPTPTAPTPREDDDCTAWTPIRKPPDTFSGSSRSAWRAKAPLASPGPLTTSACRPPPRTTGPATRIAPARRGPRGRSR
jgi:hypothetical protein